MRTPPERSGGLGLKAAGALATNHLKASNASQTGLAGAQRRQSHPLHSISARELISSQKKNPSLRSTDLRVLPIPFQAHRLLMQGITRSQSPTQLAA